MKKKKKKKKNSFYRFINNYDNKFSIIEVLVIVFFSIVFGMISGYLLTYENSNLRKIRSDKYLGEIVDTYNIIIDNYYKDVDSEKLSLAAVRGMINTLDDPYSIYLDESSTNDFNKTVSGEYVGVGIAVEYDLDCNRIVSVVPNGPADKAGLLEGDIITNIDGKDLSSLYPENLAKLISGKPNTMVVISVKRDERVIDYKVMRNKIEIWSVSSEILKDNIGYIKINTFSANSYKQFKELLKKLENNNIDSLIIDVRDNPGGHLNQTNDILKLFMKKQTVLYQTEANGKKKNIIDNTKEKRKYPIVVLINGITASSSEILASSFKDNYKDCLLIGTKTYGKGTVQKSINLKSGTSYKYTIEKWYTSNGSFIGDEGIDPDIVIENDDNDLQLLEAINWLKKTDT